MLVVIVIVGLLFFHCWFVGLSVFGDNYCCLCVSLFVINVVVLLVLLLVFAIAVCLLLFVMIVV